MECAAILDVYGTPAVIDDAMHRWGIEVLDRVVSMLTTPRWEKALTLTVTLTQR